MDRIDRIQTMEEKFDRACATVANLDEAMEKFRAVMPEIEELIAYYESEDWQTDFDADAQGQLPPALKRGVLSQDGIFDLLTDYARLKNNLQKDEV